MRDKTLSLGRVALEEARRAIARGEELSTHTIYKINSAANLAGVTLKQLDTFIEESEEIEKFSERQAIKRYGKIFTDTEEDRDLYRLVSVVINRTDEKSSRIMCVTLPQAHRAIRVYLARLCNDIHTLPWGQLQSR